MGFVLGRHFQPVAGSVIIDVGGEMPDSLEPPKDAADKEPSARTHWSVLWKDAKAPVIVVVLTLCISAASLALSILSQIDASSQYDRSQEQTLLSLVVNISQEKQDTVQSDLRTLADGQEADAIIEQLPQSDVPSALPIAR